MGSSGVSTTQQPACDVSYVWWPPGAPSWRQVTSRWHLPLPQWWPRFSRILACGIRMMSKAPRTPKASGAHTTGNSMDIHTHANSFMNGNSRQGVLSCDARPHGLFPPSLVSPVMLSIDRVLRSRKQLKQFIECSRAHIANRNPAATIPPMSTCLSQPLSAPWAARSKSAHPGTSPTVMAINDRPSISAAGDNPDDGRKPPMYRHVCLACGTDSRSPEKRERVFILRCITNSSVHARLGLQ